MGHRAGPSGVSRKAGPPWTGQARAASARKEQRQQTVARGGGAPEGGRSQTTDCGPGSVRSEARVELAGEDRVGRGARGGLLGGGRDADIIRADQDGDLVAGAVYAVTSHARAAARAAGSGGGRSGGCGGHGRRGTRALAVER